MEILSKFTRTYREPYIKTDPENHIPLDLNNTAYTIRCDICKSNAVYFGNLHNSVYYVDHTIQHDGGVRNLHEIEFLALNLQFEFVKFFCLCIS